MIPQQEMLSQSILRVDEDDTPNPISGEKEEGTGKTKSVLNQFPMQPHRESGGSSAYRLSMQKSNSQLAALAAEGRGANSFEFKEFDVSEDEEGGPISPDDIDVSRLPPAQKLRLIGRKTVCMAVVLTSFGLAMMITSFIFIRKHLNDKGFLLFFLIGLCATVPGIYASYNIFGKFLGWKGFEHSLPSYDRRVT